MDGSALTTEPGSMGGIEEGDEDAEETELEPPGCSLTDDSSIDEEDLPEWVRKHSYEGRDLDRVHALIHFLFLPAFHDRHSIASFRIISLACLRLSALLAPTSPS
ncbi:hypothetical protein K435DRAFT_856430 [Dendrothele bispora CBS 962.96]|uniref:Uncharacterized protein n=1 Tax=Dendrothele bispora (strain CBS 962.96) TaxID=1314807 RepID=A0A4V4HGG5_DENBC|nr:hypothetical protein K435DRAFT_856430 [Dendrothele bispora CBS 962.96]